MPSAPPIQISYAPDVQNMESWGRRTGMRLTSADALGQCYMRAHRWLLSLKNELVQQHGWIEKPGDSRLLFSIELPAPVRSASGMPRSPPMKLALPFHASSFFSPDRRVQWEMIFHSAVFPAMRHSVRPIGDLLNLLQCLLTGLITLNQIDQGQMTIRALPSSDWVKFHEQNLKRIFGETHYNALFRAACDVAKSFKVAPISS